MKYQDNSLIIIPSSLKNKVLEEINSLNKLLNIKIYTINELKRKILFDYDSQTVYYIKNKYNILPSIATIYLENLYYLKKQTFNEPKLIFLNDLKNDLITNNLVKENKLFIEALKEKNIILYNIPETKFNNYLTSFLSNKVTTINDNDNFYKHYVVHIDTLENEVVYLANKICTLIKNKIDINNIFISNISNEHRLIINKIFKIFNIPVNLEETNTIYNTKIIKSFLKSYQSNISLTINEIKNKFTGGEAEKIINQLIAIINKYSFIDDYNLVKDLIIEDLKATKVPTVKLKNAVNEVDFLEYAFTDKDYVFLLNFNQGILPKIVKDENYLNDKIMTKLELDTVPFLNKLNKERTINKITSIKNLNITYIDSSTNATFYPSSLIEDLELDIQEVNSQLFDNSHLYNKLKLASLIDEYEKYNILDPNLPVLANNYKLEKYDNSFTGIDKENLYKYLNNNLNLSYTSINTYYKCSFRYYLNNILKLNIYEETFMQIVGDIFHGVLEKIFNRDKEFNTLYDEIVKSMNYEYSLKERFFLKKLKKELEFIIETINGQNNYTNLKKELYEETVVVNLEGNIKITFSGKIDKLKYEQKDDKVIVAIIDYKTGNPELNLNNAIYGLEMQLPIYIYLTKNNEKFKNIEVAGFYLQKILNNEIVVDYKHSYEQLKKEKLKLQGYSNEDINILKELDSSYMDSNMIKSLKVSKNGFYPYSKVISSNKINSLVSVVEKKIKESSTSILNAEFKINPKAINNENIGCEFCKFKDICFMKEKDIVNLKEYKNLEFLGGEVNANMD